VKALFRKLWPKRLYAQLLFVAALALLAAQMLNGYLLLNGLHSRAEAEAATQLVGSYINRLDNALLRGESEIRIENELRPPRARRRGDRFRVGGLGRDVLPRGRRRAVVYFNSDNPDIPGDWRINEGLTSRAQGFLAQGRGEIADHAEVSLYNGLIADLPAQAQRQMANSGLFRQLRRQQLPAPRYALLLTVKQQSGNWLHVALPKRSVDSRSVYALLLQTLLLYIAVLVPLALVARRISRPLADLSGAMKRFGDDGNVAALHPDGPMDVRELIDTYNALQHRIGQLLSEKDVMLGAIGHDLKTPLASLRLRIEGVEDNDERSKMAASIDEMVAILDDILMLARLGRSGEALKPTDMIALVETVMDDFGADTDNLSFDVPKQKVIAEIRPTLLSRALRNLIGNALRYAGQGNVRLAQNNDMLQIIIEDNGPGIPEAQMEAMFEPFVRVESSRNKASGGTGLGLTIARAIAKAHGGDILLEARDKGGLRAILSVVASA